jgi:hypothetical protein
MIVTEGILAPYRGKNGKLLVTRTGYVSPYESPPLVPHGLFTSTFKAFGENWPSSGNRGIILVLAFSKSVPILRPGREWLALVHQTGGYLCEQTGMIATRLEPRRSILPKLESIARDNFFADSGRFDRADLLASRIVSYFTALKAIDLDCECTWRNLTEGLYPIDATPENLNRITENPPDLDSIAFWDHPRARYSDEPAIFFLAENSD